MRDGNYLDGKKHGLWISYFADGTKASEGHYVHVQKDGPWTLYHPSGHKKSEGWRVSLGFPPVPEPRRKVHAATF